jgi:hypothetical protein
MEIHLICAEKVEVLEARSKEQKVTIANLMCYQNYSIQVVASTRVGDGLKSRSIYCSTKEDCEELIIDIVLL